MAWVQHDRYEWLLEHATFVPEQGWRCKHTGTGILCATIGRSIWVRPFTGGFGEVRPVEHLYCPNCEQKPEIRHGLPIYEDELEDR